MEKQRILIDTDMGNDDIMAISMLLLSPAVQIDAFTITKGVSNPDRGIRNLQRILTYCRKSIPLALGPEAIFKTSVNFPPMDIKRAEDLELLSGVNDLPLVTNTPLVKSFDEILRSITKESYTLVALGPLTNTAALLIQYPDTAIKIDRIVFMGGGIKNGNVPPEYLTEYNIALDPPSADIVFKSGVPMTMVGIDATASAPATEAFKDRIRLLLPQTPEGQIIREIILNNNGDFNSFYDPLAISTLLDPRIVRRSLRGTISVSKIGQTVFTESPPGNVDVVLDCYANKFYDLVSRFISGF